MTTALKARFKLLEYINPATGTVSYRVSGITRAGERIRQNFADPREAKLRQTELESAYHSRTGLPDLRSTWLSEDQLRTAEAVYKRLEAAEDLQTAVDHWLKHGRPKEVKESPRLDDAFQQYKAWLSATTEYRPQTKVNKLDRTQAFVTGTPNVRVADVTVEQIEKYLDGLQGEPASKQAALYVLSSFFEWGRDRKRRWITLNPCRGIEIEGLDTEKEIHCYTVEETRKLMAAAAQYVGGSFAPYFALTFFLGLRHTEAKRLAWEQINFEDRELTIKAGQSKTGRGRTIEIIEPALAWLKAYRHIPAIRQPNHDIRRRKIAKLAGVKWRQDSARHTAISHYFRQTGSFGKTAEFFGNSEAIIKKHYLNRFTLKETEQFYAIKPLPAKPGAGARPRASAPKAAG